MISRINAVVGQNVHDRRLALDMGIEEVAAFARLSQQELIDGELGLRRFNAKELMLLTLGLSCTLAALLHGLAPE